MEKNTLGRRINMARKERGITSEKLSEMCDINAAYLRQIESGRKMPSLPMFITICQQLNVSPAYLLADSFTGGEDGNIDILIRLMDTATPKQISLINTMIKSALSVLVKE